MNGNGVLQLITVLIIFVFVLLITYYTTRFIGSYQKNQYQDKNVQIIEAARLSNNKYIQIVRIGKKILAIAVSKDTVTVLTELSEDDIVIPPEDKSDVVVKSKETFQKILEQVKKKGFLFITILCLSMTVTIPVHATANAAEGTGAYDSLGLSNDTENPSTVIQQPGQAETGEDIKDLNIGNNLSVTYQDGQGNLSGSLRILIILTLIALAPTLIIMLTSFTRILIVLHFTRAAIGTQTAPPNQVLIGLTLFLTFFIMNPVITQINDEAVKPFEAGEISQQEFFTTAMDPLRDFMYKQTQTKDVKMFLDIAGMDDVESLEDIPNMVLIPSFILSELRTAFIIGFLIYIPFIVIDMVVASTLMSMGMMMLPPTTISMPFKILLFILADGWDLVIGNLVKTFY